MGERKFMVRLSNFPFRRGNSDIKKKTKKTYILYTNDYGNDDSKFKYSVLKIHLWQMTILSLISNLQIFFSHIYKWAIILFIAFITV